MNVDEIYEGIIKVFNDKKQKPIYYTDWDKLKNIKHRLPSVIYIKKRKDHVYVGEYRVGKIERFNRETLKVEHNFCIKSLNNHMSFYPHKVLIKRKPATFKTLTYLTFNNNEIFREFIDITKKIYNIHPSIKIPFERLSVVLLDEIKNVTIEEYVNNYFEKESDFVKRALSKLPVNNIKMIYLIKDKCMNKETILRLIEGKTLNPKDDTLGNRFYVRDQSIKSKGSMSAYNNIDNYIMSYGGSRDREVYELINTGDRENVILGRTIFINKYPELFKDTEDTNKRYLNISDLSEIPF